MNAWDTRIKEHGIWAEMNSFGATVDVASQLSDLDTETIASIERLRTVLTYLGKRLAAADPLIVPPGPLQNLLADIAQARVIIESFTSDRNPAHLTHANAIIDNALDWIVRIPGAYSPEELGGLVSSVEKYRSAIDEGMTTANKALAALGAESNSVRSRLSELASNVQTEQQKISQVVSDYQGQFSSAQEKRSKDFSTTLLAAQDSISKLTSEYQNQFSSSQESRIREFSDSEKLRQAAYNDLELQYKARIATQDANFAEQQMEARKLHQDALETLAEGYKSDAKLILDSIKNHQSEVEKVVGVIGNLAVTSGYLQTANKAQKLVWFWQGMTVAAMLAWSVLAYRTLPLLGENNGRFNWGGFAGRVLLLVSLGVIAAYSGTQADKLFSDEKRNRKLALELEAIGPYLAPLPLEDQNKFRLQIGERSFGRVHDPDAMLHGKSPATALHLLKSKELKDALELMADLVKRLKD